MFIVLICVYFAFFNSSDEKVKKTYDGVVTEVKMDTVSKPKNIKDITTIKTEGTKNPQETTNNDNNQKGENSDDLYKKYKLQFNSICSKMKNLVTKKKIEFHKPDRNSDTIVRINANLDIKRKELETSFNLWKKNGLGKQADDPKECECN